MVLVQLFLKPVYNILSIERKTKLAGIVGLFLNSELNIFDLEMLFVFDVNPATGASKEIYDENYPTWINWIKGIKWVKDGFLMVRDYEGWEQIYYHHNDGRLKKRLTTGKNWNINILRVDEKKNGLFYCSDAETATRTNLYWVRLDGKAQKRVTFGAYTHGKFSFSPDGNYVITTYDNVTTPTRMALIRTTDNKVKVIADSKGPKFDSASIKFPEMVWLKSDDGLFDLPARIRWPKNMKKEQKYPVIIRVYGGPNHPSVADGWTPVRYINEEGYIQMVIDHRGAGHNGKKGMDCLHRNLGKWEMADYISWVKWLRRNPNVDPERILISGGSYGGYMVAMALTYGAGYFQYGICEYPVIDWQLYDSHYTERYMDSPKDNPEGYKAASVLTYADRYQSKGNAMMLIQHGMMDDNVHMQNTMQLIDLLQHKNKTFELMIYPNERHGWRKKIPFTNGVRERFKAQYLFQANPANGGQGQHSTTKPEAQDSDMKGDEAINFKAVDTEGKEVALTDLKGKVVYIDVWATWCGPCKKEIPYMKKLEEEFGDNKEIVFVSVSVDVPKAQQKWKEVVQKLEMKGLQLFIGEGKKELLQAYKINGIPRFILIGKDGKIISAKAPKPSSDEIRPLLKEALAHQ